MTEKNKQTGATSEADKDKSKICPRAEDFSKWYIDVVAAADLAEHAPVRGSMIIKPYGYSLWEMIQGAVDSLIKSVGVENAYFPLFIPESFLNKEKEHVAGFSPELAVVTHAGGKKLQEPLVVRPTSETIIYDAFSRWIQSYRDLPLTINQWANIVRWELRPRLFLRTTEFLWQEGHTAHANAAESKAYALMIIDKVYSKFVEEYLAMPVLAGVKSASERFAGAMDTYCIESLMQDGKSLQAGTSHDLSDHFAKSFDVSYLDDKGEKQYVHQTSWGVSTRLIGGLIMSHSDDKGLVLPPRIAPIQAVITTIAGAGDEGAAAKKAEELKAELSGFRLKVDSRDLRPGEKYYEWEKKGVPVRIELGPKDLANNACVLVRRDTGEKAACPLDGLAAGLEALLNDIQKALFDVAKERFEKTKQKADDWDGLARGIEAGGYIYAFWCGDAKCEAKIKEELKAVTRCLPFGQEEEPGEHACVCCGQTAPGKRWVFAKAY